MAVDFLTGVELRRRWRVEEKLRVVAEVGQPGICFAEAARRHEMSAGLLSNSGLLWNWRRQVQRGVLRPVIGLRFLPVQLTLEPTSRSVASPMQPTGQAAFVDGMIEIALGAARRSVSGAMSAPACSITSGPVAGICSCIRVAHTGLRPVVALARQRQEVVLGIRAPFIGAGRIGLDTGAGLGGALSRAVLEDERITCRTVPTPQGASR